MIGFRDFAPEQLAPPSRSHEGTLGPLADALRAANEWVRADRVDVVNVETVVLPLYSHVKPPAEGTAAPAIHVGLGNYWFACLQVIRVWYRLPDPA